MGIQGLLHALKPYVEFVHVQKYAGQRVGIDAYSWLHKGAHGGNWDTAREETPGKSEKMPQYVSYCINRIKMLQFNKVTPVVVFDGGRLPLKALTLESRRRTREAHLQKAEDKLAEGDKLGAQEFFQKAIEITPTMAHELVKVLRELCVEYVVAPYEADAQLAHLARLPPEEGGVSAIITEDSDLLAYGCNAVLYKMDKYGSGEEISLARILHCNSLPMNAISFRNFTPDLFLAMCILAGCDFLASIPGVGVKKAHALLAQHRDIHRVLHKLKILKHAVFPEGYIENFWQAKALFKHARVYDRKARCLIPMNPVPCELLKQFDGDMDFLGPDLPQSRAIAIAEGQLDPSTMRSFDALPPDTTPFCSSTGKSSPEPEFLAFGRKRTPESAFTTLERSEVGKMIFQCPSSRPKPQSSPFLEDSSESLAFDDTITESESLTQPTPTSYQVDQVFLAQLQQIAFPEERNAHFNRHSVEEVDARVVLPNNNPFKRQKTDKNRSSLLEKLDFTIANGCQVQKRSGSGDMSTESDLLVSFGDHQNFVDQTICSPISATPTTENGSYSKSFERSFQASQISIECSPISPIRRENGFHAKSVESSFSASQISMECSSVSPTLREIEFCSETFECSVQDSQISIQCSPTSQTQTQDGFCPKALEIGVDSQIFDQWSPTSGESTQTLETRLQASQFSIRSCSSSVLTEISPNMAHSRANANSGTQSKAGGPAGIVGKKLGRLKKSKFSPGVVDSTSKNFKSRSSRSVGGGILRFFKPVETVV